MDIQHYHRGLRAGLIALSLNLCFPANAAMVSLRRFDVDQPGGSFTAVPAQDPDLIAAVGGDGAGLLSGFTGVTDRTFAIHDFTAFNSAPASSAAIARPPLDLRGFAATYSDSNLGANVQCCGQLERVTLPGPLFLIATPLLGLLAGQWLRRGFQSPS